MPYILKVLGTKPEERHYNDNNGEQVVERQLAVTFGIYAKNGEIVATEPSMKRTIGFPADVTSEAIKEELTAQLATFQSDRDAVVRSTKAAEANANALKVQSDLDGLEI